MACVFNDDWLKEEEFAEWLLKVETNKTKAKCSLCLKTFNLSNMGRRALKSHATGAKHKQACTLKCQKAQPKLLNFFSSAPSELVSGDTNDAGPSSTNSPLSPKSEPKLVSAHKKHDPYFVKNSATRAEILWTLKLVMSHYSNRSSDDIAELFKLMFPDSDIVKSFEMKKDKVSYVLVYGLAPFFREQLECELLRCENVVVCFDESLNKVARRGQMDIHIRYWNSQMNKVETRFYTSAFLGHSTSEDLLNALKEALVALNLKKIVQFSMDGPNTNWKLMSLFKEEMKVEGEPHNPQLLEAGSCCLHVVHGAFRAGFKKVDRSVESFLRSLYNLFKASPARRADYTHYSGSKVFPLKFCGVRWVGNADVALRAMEILPNVVKYINGVGKKPPSSNSYTIVKTLVNAGTIKPRLGFFYSFASQLEPFLTAFQTDKPVFPFLHDDLHSLLRQVMARFVKSSVLEEANTSTKLMKVVMKAGTLLPVSNIDIGFSAKNALKEAKANERTHLEFRLQCQQILQHVVEKMQQRSPLQYRLVKGISGLVPSTIVNAASVSVKCIDTALTICVEANRIEAAAADATKREFSSFIDLPSVRAKMQTFSRHKDRLDVLYSELLDGNDDYKHLFHFVKLCLILSHGNATVESGFSVNKSTIVENLQEQSLVAHRLVYDSVLKAGGIFNINITSSMLTRVRNASRRRKEALEEGKRKQNREQQQVDERKRAIREVKELERKKMKLTEESNAHIAQIDSQIDILKKNSK